VRLLGGLLMCAAAAGAVFYLLWWAGAIPWLRQEDAVRLAALLVMLFLFTVVGFLGYVAAVTKPPQHNKLTGMLSGEAREAARLLAAIALEVRRSGLPLRPPAAVVAGGETVVTVRGGGVGGRNQELALALALHLREMGGFSAASMGTDGVDGPTDAAGAMVTDRTIPNAVEKGLSPEEYL